MLFFYIIYISLTFYRDLQQQAAKGTSAPTPSMPSHHQGWFLIEYYFSLVKTYY